MKTFDQIEETHRSGLAHAVSGLPKLPRNVSRIDRLRWIVENKTAARTEGVLMDLFTASMLVQVHDALGETNRAMFVRMPIHRMVSVGWKLVSGKKS